MFYFDDDKTIYITRGDVACFAVTADDKGEPYTFQAGDLVRIKVMDKKNCSNVAFQKDFPVTETSESVSIILTEAETKIGDVISKPKDYWYEIELNPNSAPQTIIGYDEDGPKIFKLFPEGRDIPPSPVPEEVIKSVDDELDMTSNRPVQNQAIARAMVMLKNSIDMLNAIVTDIVNSSDLDIELEFMSAYEELVGVRYDINGTEHETAGGAVRSQVNTLTTEKLALPKDDEGQTLHGTLGQFAVSDGSGGCTWLTVVDGNEVEY